MNATPEEWRPVVGYEGLYEVSDHGRVRSFDRYALNGTGAMVLHRGRVLKTAPMKSGHLRLKLYGLENRLHLVHTLVLTAFVAPRPVGMEGCHNNGDPSDNRLTNLRWDTRVANALDLIRHGKNANVNKTHCPQGHEYSPNNTFISFNSNGRERRGCRTCARQRRRDYRQRKHAATPVN